MTNTGEMWDRRFAEQSWPAEPDPYLVELAGPLRVGRGLDLGSGPGRNSLWLAANGWEMTLVDASAVGLDQASRSAETLGVTVSTVHADLASWEPEQACFDLVVVANLHPGPDALRGVLTNAARALRSGGHLYVVGHHVASLGRHGPPDPDRLLTPQRLQDALPPGLAVDILGTRHRAADHGPEQASVDTIVLAWATKHSADEDSSG